MGSFKRGGAMAQEGWKLLSEAFRRAGDIARSSGDLGEALDQYEQAKKAWDDGTIDKAIQEVKDLQTGSTAGEIPNTTGPASSSTPTPTPTVQAPQTIRVLSGDGPIPTSFPIPGGGSVSLQEVLKTGMSQFPAGKAPFGTIPGSGDPFWPLDDPEFEDDGIAESPQETPIGSMDSALVAIQKLLSRKSDVKGLLEEISRIVRPGTGSSLSSPSSGSDLSPAQLLWFQKRFVHDCVTHARFVYEGKSEKALEISAIWSGISRAHPDRIADIALNVQNVKGASSCQAWFDEVLTEDWKKVHGEAPPDSLLSK